MAWQAERVLVTGATGFVGRAVVRELEQRNYRVRALVRRAGSVGELEREGGVEGGVEEAVGDVTRAETLGGVCAGCDAVIHLVGIIAEQRREGVTFARVHAEGTRNIVRAAAEAGVRRYVHMSAMGTRAGAVSRYHQTKWEGEEAVRASGLAWTIFRPSLIVGPEGEFAGMMRGWALGERAPWVMMPYFGAGLLGQRNENLVTPVHVADVAWLFVEALGNATAVGKTYEVGGLERLTWKELMREGSRVVRGRAKAAVGIPAWWAGLLARSGLPVGFNLEQVQMSQEGNAADMGAVMKDFAGFVPRGWREGLLRGGGGIQ